MNKAINGSEPFEKEAVAWGIAIPEKDNMLDIILVFLSKAYAEMICDSIKGGIVVPLGPIRK